MVTHEDYAATDRLLVLANCAGGQLAGQVLDVGPGGGSGGRVLAMGAYVAVGAARKAIGARAEAEHRAIDGKESGGRPEHRSAGGGEAIVGAAGNRVGAGRSALHYRACGDRLAFVGVVGGSDPDTELVIWTADVSRQSSKDEL